MSDLTNNNQVVKPSADEEATKTVKKVGPRSSRHRRSERPQDEVPQATPPASGNRTVRIPPQSAGTQGTAAPSAQGGAPQPPRTAFDPNTARTPRPKALDRAGTPVKANEIRRPANANEIRRPVNAPGYTRQEPLGRTSDPNIRVRQTSEADKRQAIAAEEEEDDKKGISRILLVILAVLLILALLLLGLHLIPDNQEGTLGDLKRSVQGTLSGIVGSDPTASPAAQQLSHASEFYSETSSEYAPAEITFYLVTDQSVSQVQLYDGDGQALDGVVYQDEREDGSVEWGIIVNFEQPYFGMVRPRVYTDTWEDTGLSQQISVVEETIRETSTVAPTLQVVNDILDFSASPAQGTAPVNIVFSMTTSLNIKQVRLVDEHGDPLEAEASVLVDNASTRIWALNYTFDRAYSGVVRAQANIDGTWLDSNKLVSLSIQGQTVTVTETPVLVTMVPSPTLPPVDAPAADEGMEEMAVLPETDEMDEAAVEWEDEEWVQPDEETVDETVDGSLDDVPSEPTPAAPVTQAPLVNNALPVPTAQEETPTPDVPAQTPAPETKGEAAQEAEAQETGLPKLTAKADESADPSLIKGAVIYNGTKKTETYDRPAVDLINMPDADGYARQPYGVMTYRGSSFRQNAAEGTVNNPSDMEVLWKMEAGSIKSNGKTVFYGVSWTGQPLIIKWSKEVREMSNIYEEKKGTKALREVIVAGDDGKIYFLDLETGEKTRAVIDAGTPMRGTPSVHSLGFPVLSVGQYARKMAKKTYDIGMRVYNLLNAKQLFMIDGLDGKLDRPYYDVGSFETSSLFDYNSDTMITAGTNGMLYLTKLNTTIDRTAGTLTVNPSHVSLKSKTKGESDKAVAVESSIAAYQNYVFYADMGGILRCVDTSSMTTCWAVATGDAVEASVALDLVDDGQTLWLYTANTLQNRKNGPCQIRRYNAMTGALDWTYEVPVKKNTKKGITAGAKASPVIGRNGLSDYVYFTVSNATDVDGSAADAVLIALDKNTGKMVWHRPLTAYSYSSPVAVYNDEGKGWIIQAASDGMIELLDGLTGAVVGQLKIEGTITASPAVYKDTMVIGTTGKGTSYIYGIILK